MDLVLDVLKIKINYSDSVDSEFAKNFIQIRFDTGNGIAKGCIRFLS